jgi:hypothetical protein
VPSQATERRAREVACLPTGASRGGTQPRFLNKLPGRAAVPGWRRGARDAADRRLRPQHRQPRTPARKAGVLDLRKRMRERDGFEPSVPRQKDVCEYRDRRRSEAAEPQIGGKLPKTPIWHHCVTSAADHPMRQRSRPRHERVGLTGKVLCRDGHRHFGSEDPGVAQNSSRQQFLGLWSFLCRLHLDTSQNTSTANDGRSTDQGETTKLTTLMEQEKQGISERLARLGAEREKLSGQLDELEIAERVLARFGVRAVTTEKRRGARPARTTPAPAGERGGRSSKKAPGVSISEASLKAVQAHGEGATPAELLNYILRKFGMTVRPNHLGAALQRHRRAGLLENRDQRWHLSS